jgi:3',5'-cyclic AMP phosphodiesterase CpdA
MSGTAMPTAHGEDDVSASSTAVIAHLSDCHLPWGGDLPLRHLDVKRGLGWLNWQRKRRFLYDRAAADALVADAWAAGAQHVAITGDLVNLGLPDEYRAARDWLATVGAPETVSVVPGNHDSYVEPEGTAGVALWAAHMADDAYGAALPRVAGRPTAGPAPAGPACGPAFPYVRRVGPVALLGVNSACPTAVGYAGGTVGPVQRRRLAGLLERLGAEGLVRVVLIHHPPKPGQAPPGRALGDAADLEAVVLRTGAEFILHGHNHVVEATRIGATRVLGIASAGMARAYHHEPAARYALIRITADRTAAHVTLEHRGLAGDGSFIVRTFGTSEFTCAMTPASIGTAP